MVHDVSVEHGETDARNKAQVLSGTDGELDAHTAGQGALAHTVGSVVHVHVTRVDIRDQPGGGTEHGIRMHIEERMGAVVVLILFIGRGVDAVVAQAHAEDPVEPLAGVKVYGRSHALSVKTRGVTAGVEGVVESGTQPHKPLVGVFFILFLGKGGQHQGAEKQQADNLFHCQFRLKMIRNAYGKEAPHVEGETAVAGERSLVGLGGLQAVVFIRIELSADIQEDTHLLGDEKLSQETYSETEDRITGAHMRKFSVNLFPVMAPFVRLLEVVCMRKARTQIKLGNEEAGLPGHIEHGVGKNVDAGEGVGIEAAAGLFGVTGTGVSVQINIEPHTEVLRKLVASRYAEGQVHQVKDFLVVEIGPDVFSHVDSSANLGGNMPGKFHFLGRHRRGHPKKEQNGNNRFSKISHFQFIFRGQKSRHRMTATALHLTKIQIYYFELKLLAGNDAQEGKGQNLGIEPDGTGTKVVDVVIQAGDHLLDGVRVAIVQGGVAGNTGGQLEQILETVVTLHDLVHEVQALGTVAHEAHVSHKDVPELRKLIQVMGAEEAADTGETGVVLSAAQGGNTHGLGIRTHGAELDQVEQASAFAHALLPVEDGAAVIQLDKQGAEGDERGEDHQQHEGYAQVEAALDKKVRLGEGALPVNRGLAGLMGDFLAAGAGEEDAVYAAQLPAELFQVVGVGAVRKFYNFLYN